MLPSSSEVPSGNSTSISPSLKRLAMASRAAPVSLLFARATKTVRCSRARVPKKGQSLTSDLAMKDSGATAEKITMSSQLE